jgi:hypothetical protein
VLDESLALARAADSRYASGHALATSGDLDWRRGRASQAVTPWTDALTVFAELADRRGVAGCLERIAVASADAGDGEAAAWLFGAAQAQHATLGLQLRATQETDHAHFASYEQQEVARAGCPGAWSTGQNASLAESVAYARARSNLDR